MCVSCPPFLLLAHRRLPSTRTLTKTTTTIHRVFTSHPKYALGLPSASPSSTTTGSGLSLSTSGITGSQVAGAQGDASPSPASPSPLSLLPPPVCLLAPYKKLPRAVGPAPPPPPPVGAGEDGGAEEQQQQGQQGQKRRADPLEGTIEEAGVSLCMNMWIGGQPPRGSHPDHPRHQTNHPRNQNNNKIHKIIRRRTTRRFWRNWPRAPRSSRPQTSSSTRGRGRVRCSWRCGFFVCMYVCVRINFIPRSTPHT